MTGNGYIGGKIIVAGLSTFLLAALGAPFAKTARAQGSRKDDVVFNAQGQPMGGATVRVCTASSSGEPCSPLASIYSDNALTMPMANPLTTDGLGNYNFYAAPGRYTIEISGPGLTTYQMPNVILPSDPSSPTFTTVTTTSGISAFSLSLSGNLTVTGSAAVTGSLSVAGAPVPSTGVDNQWTANQRFGGPIPYRDITAYMPSGGCADNASGADPMSTMTIMASSTSATLVSDPGGASYKIGCGLSISLAGPNSTIAMPAGGTASASGSAGKITYTLSNPVNLPGGIGYSYDNPVVVTGCANSSFDTPGAEIVGTTTDTVQVDSSVTGSTTGCTVSFLIGHAEGITGNVPYYYDVSAIDNLDGVSPAIGPYEIANGKGTAGSGSASDNFMRANGGLGSNWTTISGFTAPTITSDQVVGNTACCSTIQGAAYTGTSFSANQMSVITFGGTTSTSAVSQVFAFVRLSGSTGYACQFSPGGTIYLYKFTSVSSYTILGTISGSLANGDTGTLQAVGTSLKCFVTHNGQITATATATDSTYSSGSPGLGLTGTDSDGNGVITAWYGEGIPSKTIGRNSTDGLYDYNWIGWPYTSGARMFAVWRSYDDSHWTLAGCPTTNGWSDWGFNAPCPPWVPSSPPASNQPQSLKTTITNVSGSTITVANAASNTATAAPAYHDETTFLAQCLTAANNDQSGAAGGDSYCYVPPTPSGYSFYFNSDLPFDTLSLNNGSHLEVAGSMWMNTWPWILTQSGYYVHGLAHNTTPRNFGNFPATEVHFGANVPAAYVFHSTRGGLEHLAADGLLGYGLVMNIDPETGSGGQGCFDNLYFSMNSAASGVPIVFDSNTLGVSGCQGGAADNLNLEPAATGFPASILLTNNTYNGIGQCCITFGYTQFLYHHVYVESPGGSAGGQGSALTLNSGISEDHGTYPTGGMVHLDSGNNDGTTNCSGGPCLLPYGVAAGAHGEVNISINNADAANQMAYTISGQNYQSGFSSYLAATVSGADQYGQVCIHGSTICNVNGGLPTTVSTALGYRAAYVSPVTNDAGIVPNNGNVAGSLETQLYTGYNLGLISSPGAGQAASYNMFIAPPHSVAATCSTSGGSIADGTYYFSVVEENNGTSIPSAEAYCTISGGGGSGSITVSWTDTELAAEADSRVYMATQPCNTGGCYENEYKSAPWSGSGNPYDQSLTITTFGSGWTSDNITNHQFPTAALWNTSCAYCQVQSPSGGTYGFAGPAVGSLPSSASAGFLDVYHKPATYANTPTCNSGMQGDVRTISDSTTNTWGASITTGGGSDPVLAFCDGTNWTVAAK